VVIILILLALVVVIKTSLERQAKAKLLAGQLGPSEDYYRDRSLRTGLATAAWNPWGLVALGCSVGPSRVSNSGACQGFRHGLVKVENTVLKYIPIPGARQIVDGVANVEGRAYRLVKPVGEYVGVAAEDAASAVVGALGSAAGAVGGAASDAGHAVYDNTLGRIF